MENVYPIYDSRTDVVVISQMEKAKEDHIDSLGFYLYYGLGELHNSWLFGLKTLI